MVTTASGAVSLTAETRDDVEATGHPVHTEWQDDGMTLVLSHTSQSISVRCPTGTPVSVGTTSGHVRLAGRFGRVSVTSASGAIVVDEANGADLRTAGGSIDIATCTGPCRVTTAAGKINGGTTASIHAHSMSGSIHIARVVGDVHARTVSGAVEVHCRDSAEIDVRTVSGKVVIGLPENVMPRLRLKTLGRVKSQVQAGSDCTVEAVSVSGSIDVRAESARAQT
jgi:DUF4097 and DUF4098 domain-containing protein YvlB